MGLLVEQGGGRRPTRAAVLLFGANPAFRQLVPRPVVDCQRFMATREAADTEDRWFDRVVLEENLVRTWRFLIEGWYQKFAEHPFRLDPATMQRDDTPPDYRAFRESMINLLMHQDYADHSRTAVIRHYRDQTIFWNSGDAFAANPHLLEPGEREVRNPRIVLAFRRIGLSEHAGWGLRDVFRNWRQLGYVPPRIVSDRRRKSFELVLTKEALLSDSQFAWQQGLGVGLMDEEARTLALACREPDIALWQIKAVTGLSGPESAVLADRLVDRGLIEPAGPDRYVLAEHLRKRRPRSDQVSDQARVWPAVAGDHVRPPRPHMVADRTEPTPGSVDMSTAHVRSGNNGMSTAHRRHMSTAHVEDRRNMSTAHVERMAETPAGRPEPLTRLSATHRRIVERCEVPRRLAELMDALGATNRGHFKKRHLDPLIRAGIVTMTNPENPRAPGQRYVLTAAGLALRAARTRNGREDEGGHAEHAG